MNLPGLPPPKPIPLKDRSQLVFIERARLDVEDGAFVAVNADGTRTHIPVGGVAGLMLEPGARISHAAIALAARVGTLVTWIGEAGVRFYSAGHPGGARADKLLWQASIALNPEARLRVVRRMYEIRFGEAAPTRRSIDQLRGIEGARVRKSYELLAQTHGVHWRGRNYDPGDWAAADTPNRCLSSATACLHGLTEAAVLTAGYAPAIGFLHTGKPLSFVYDIADLWKLQTVIPEAFRVAGPAPAEQARHAARESGTACVPGCVPQVRPSGPNHPPDRGGAVGGQGAEARPARRSRRPGFRRGRRVTR